MINDPDLEALVVSLESWLSEGSDLVSNLRAKLEEDEEPEVPDPWPIPVVEDFVVTPSSDSIQLSWTEPDTNRNITGFQLTYGWGGQYRGSIPSGDGVTTAVIPNVPSGTQVSIDFGYRVDNVGPSSDQLLRLTATTTVLPGPEPGDPGDFPSSGTWAEKEAWIKQAAGAKGDLQLVNSAASASATGLPIQWSDAWGGILVWEPCELSDLEIPGQIVLNSGAGQAIRILNTKFRGLWSNGGGKANYIKDVTVTHRPHNLGQGALNALANGVVQVIGADISGFADGIQYQADLSLARCYFHDAAYTSTTHNDDTQGYPQSKLTVVQSLFDHTPPYPNVRNGHIFTDGQSPAGGDIVDSILRVRGQYRSQNWVANSHNGSFRYNRCLIDGKFGGAGHTLTDCEVIP